MNGPDICKIIQENLEKQNIHLSASQIAELYINTLSSIDSTLEEENTLDIQNFGSFIRKKGITTSSLTFFKPINRLTDRIK